MQGHHARKRFGQHFLTDSLIIDKIVNLVPSHCTDPVVEIGPGLGAITIPLLQRVAKLSVIEFDRDLVARLQQWPAYQEGRLTVHSIDVLKFDFLALSQQQNARLLLIGNLPYNISTPLLIRLGEQKAALSSLYFMLQKEVVDRIVAAPGSKTYGRLSVILQYHFQTECLFTIPPEAFSPPPKVNSAMLRLTPHETIPAASDLEHFHEVVRLAFNQRRKTLSNSLKPLLNNLNETQRATCDPYLSRRAETLSVAEFVFLSEQLKT